MSQEYYFHKHSQIMVLKGENELLFLLKKFSSIVITQIF